jgi:hypothetical protein
MAIKKIDAERIAAGLEEMRAVKLELAAGAILIRTTEATALAPFNLSEETLLGYPEWIIPRYPVNPRATRPTYLWDPQDLKVLPFVLRGWQRARKDDTEEAFKADRVAKLEARELAAMGMAAPAL